MKVRIDHARCETNALCMGMAPDLFELDGEYPVQVPESIAAARHEEVREIVASCPTGALSIEVDDRDSPARDVAVHDDPAWVP